MDEVVVETAVVGAVMVGVACAALNTGQTLVPSKCPQSCSLDYHLKVQ